MAGKFKPFEWHASSGHAQNHTYLLVSGHNDDIDTATAPETISDISGGGLYPFPTSASTASVVSSDANDTAAGTGARTILLSGLNTDYEAVTETIILAGATPVVSTASFWRINSATVLTAGTGLVNAGSIDITVDSSVIGTINIGENITHSGAYTVPKDYTFVLLKTQFAIGKQQDINGTIRLYTRDNKNSLPFYAIAQYTCHSNSGVVSIDMNGAPFVITEQSDIRTDVTYISGNNVDATFVLIGYLIYNGEIRER